MKRIQFIRESARGLLVAVALLFLWGTGAHAAIDIDGVTGDTFNLVAEPGYIITSDGDSFLMWGYSNGAGNMQYPGPTMIVNQGDPITVTLRNNLPPAAGRASIVFPGQQVTASGGAQGLLTREAAQSDDPGTPEDESLVTYTFTPSQPGTYLYRSGTRPDLQVEMGLVGALIVRPTGFDAVNNRIAYNHADSAYHHEFLYLITEMDPRIHRQVEYGEWNLIDTTTYFATNWFINGRNFPDLMSEPNVPWLPTQPYNCQPRMHPGEKVLLRMIGAGVDEHAMHLHGNDFETIAVDGRLLTSGDPTVQGPDLAWMATTIVTAPGGTADVIWKWDAEKLGWDIYGHQAGVVYPRSEINPVWPGNICDNYVPGDPNQVYDPYTQEYCPDHGVPFPVILPTRDSLTFGQFYSGSPFLGGTGNLAPGDPGLNANAGFFYMWHSHTEKELTSNDIWPGGLVSFMIVEHPKVPLD